MAVLITGGAGFIGSSLTKRLLELGYAVTAVDNFNSYYNPWYKRENIQSFLDSPGYTMFEGDINDRDFLNNIFGKHKIEKIIHLAASVGVRNSLLYPKQYRRNNVVGTQTLLDAAVEHNVSQFIFASSSSIYGNNSPIPFREDAVIDSPLNPYAQSKKDAELLCKNYHDTYGIPVVIFRFFTVYGTKGRPDMSPYIFTEAILKKKKIQIFGDGSAKRDFTFVDDIVKGMFLGMGKPFPFEVFNLGDSSPIDVLTFIRIIEKLTRKKAKFTFASVIPSEMRHTYANIGKAKNLLGYKPKISTEEGMDIFTQWFKEYRM